LAGTTRWCCAAGWAPSPRSRALPPQAAAVGAYRSLHQEWVSASPALDTLLEAAPIAFQGRLVQCILRLHPGKTTADPRLPRPANRRPRRVAGQACPRLHQPRLPAPAAWLLKQAPAARKGPARTPDARAAITLQPPSPRLQAARRDVSQRPEPGRTAVESSLPIFAPCSRPLAAPAEDRRPTSLCRRFCREPRRGWPSDGACKADCSSLLWMRSLVPRAPGVPRDGSYPCDSQ